MPFWIGTEGGTEAMRRVAEEVVYETLQTLLPKHKKHRQLWISIENTRKEGGLGFCYSDGDDYWIDVENKPSSLYSFIETLCHECVHIKQYVRNELSLAPGRQMWMGDDYTDVAYRKQPWEKEAFSLQKSLTKAYLKSKGVTMKRAKELSARARPPWEKVV